MWTLAAEKKALEVKTREKEEELISKIDEQETLLQSLLGENEALQSENNNLKLSINQSMRCLKRGDLKLGVMANRIEYLSKEVTEKEAIIKYLEGKSEVNRCSSRSSFEQDSLMHIDELNCSTQKQDISFAKLKRSNEMTF